MMKQHKNPGSFMVRSQVWQRVLLAIPALSLLVMTAPAMAHHAMGNRLPSNFLEGFLSGLAHPLIGPDHFAFIVAVGLLAAARPQGLFIPVSFMLAAMLGTGLHLTGLSLPGIELLVAASVLLVGILLSLKDAPATPVVIGLVAIAGIFHGYAYGESIFGAEMTPVFAYLLGFTCIQLVISISVSGIAQRLVKPVLQPVSARFRAAGLVICGIGLAFVSSNLIAGIFPG